MSFINSFVGCNLIIVVERVVSTATPFALSCSLKYLLVEIRFQWTSGKSGHTPEARFENLRENIVYWPEGTGHGTLLWQLAIVRHDKCPNIMSHL